MKNFNIKVLFSVFMLVLTTLACATPDISALLNPLPNDDFSSSSSGWGIGTDSFSSVEYQDGGLKMIVFESRYVTWSTPDTEVYENTHMEVNVTNQSTDPESMFGFVCNEQGTTNAFYYVGVSPDGYYAFIKSSVALDDVYLKEGTSDLVSANPSSMRLGLDCGNGLLTLYVNGQKVDSVSDTTYTSGTVGLFAASDDERNGTTVIFDDFVMTKLGE
ncbi:MAG: hypothetical protein JNM02_04160 [Anaerolineales bacterium]|nr:hypothetical protein [Anaerolineales bacterium]